MDTRSKMSFKIYSVILGVSALCILQTTSFVGAEEAHETKEVAGVAPSALASPLASVADLKKLDQEFFKIAELPTEAQPAANQALADKLEDLAKKVAPSAELEAQIGRAYGQVALSKGISNQVKLGKIIHDHAEKAIELDPNNALANEVFGIWHFEVSKIGGFAVTFGRILFGSIPSGSSFESALKYLKRAQELDEKALFFKLTYAKVLEHEGMKKEAKTMLEAALKLRDQYPTDKVHRKEAEELLKQIN